MSVHYVDDRSTQANNFCRATRRLVWSDVRRSDEKIMGEFLCENLGKSVKQVKHQLIQ